ncbi:esterase, PHB depolymerase family [Poseidonocella pacifica]|uniref:Esterase, PHB depolymerase family n=1 Tax=Poseidonocella pacifica TaxID=871651 RepID=A0A1I0Y3S4_9RHOB|nr:PHB depolymerase family esterase [Poseidonocella pacifica]SFB07824.1 esterase, PHB depolymerase family [Poseidonocella pacifica]
MKLNVGALRAATDKMRSAHLPDATNLVNKTLAQHGLLPGGNPGQADDTGSGLPNFTSILQGLKTPFQEGHTPEADLPAGAEFQRGSYTCEEGSRNYRLYIPASAPSGVTGLVVMLHGCTQSPEDFAAGTNMNALAEEHGFAVLYPHQSRGENAQSCWNWFRRGDQMRDRGEPAILAGMAEKVAADLRTPKGATFVAGLSAGAAMAVILGEAYPDVFAAIGAHSGLPLGAAKDVTSAFSAMAGTDMSAQSDRKAATTPTIIFHGTADSTVHPSNADAIARQVRDSGPKQTFESEAQVHMSGRKAHRTIAETGTGQTVLEQWSIEGLGHAWSGGRSEGSYTDPKGPDASVEMIRFFFDTVKA